MALGTAPPAFDQRQILLLFPRQGSREERLEFMLAVVNEVIERGYSPLAPALMMEALYRTTQEEDTATRIYASSWLSTVKAVWVCSVPAVGEDRLTSHLITQAKALAVPVKRVIFDENEIIATPMR